MSQRAILRYPDPRLRVKAQRVVKFGEELKSLVQDLLDTMYIGEGAGLAATQIGEPWRVLVIDVAGEEEELHILVNPEIVYSSGTQRLTEGCLSFPGVFELVDRAETVRVRAQDVEGQGFEFSADKLLAVAIQHEIDHLNGILFVDRMKPLQKKLAEKKAKKRGDNSDV